MSRVPEDVRARWTAFGGKIRARYAEILVEAQAGFDDLIQSDPTDAITYGNALMAIHTRVINLGQLLDQTYEREVAPRAGYDAGLERERAALREWLETSWETKRVELAAAIYRAMWPLVAEAMKRPTPCTRCGQPLEKATPHRIEALHCRSCQAMNQVAPEAVVTTYFGGAPHAFGEVAALPPRAAIRAAKNASAPFDEEAMERAALVAYCTASAAIAPMAPADQQAWIESRMKMWRAANG